MSPVVEEASRFISLATDDERAFHVLMQHANVRFATACFHGQQAVEKALKAVLILRGVEYPHTHNVEELARLVEDSGGELPISPRELRRLNPFAVEFRYDDTLLLTIPREEAAAMVRSVLQWVEGLIQGQ